MSSLANEGKKGKLWRPLEGKMQHTNHGAFSGDRKYTISTFGLLADFY